MLFRSGAGNEPSFKEKGAGIGRQFAEWVNTENTSLKNSPGVFFFDTKNQENPQKWDDPSNTGILTEKVTMAPGGGMKFLMRGFIYLNSSKIDSSGLGNGVNLWKNMPGEPFNDWGIDLDGDGKPPYRSEERRVGKECRL